MKLKGSSMIYAMTISMVISLMLGGFFLVNKHQRKLFDSRYFQELARDNLLSGIRLYLNDYQKLPSFWSSSLYESNSDSIEIVSENWGLLGLIHGKGTHNSSYSEFSCLVGQGDWNNNPALWLEDQNTPLMVVGNTYLAGNLFLPESGIKPGNILQKSFKGNISSIQLSSRGGNGKMESLQFSDELREDLLYVSEITDLGYPFLVENEEFLASWTDRTNVISHQGEVIIDNSTLKGKHKIIAHKVIIRKDAKLDHTLIIARKIEIEPQFIGFIQGIATEEIIIGKGANLLYPSILAVFNNEFPVRVMINENCLIEGGVIVHDFSKKRRRNQEDYILIGKGSEIYGLVHVAHNLDLRGKCIWSCFHW